ncbi:MAG TPA: HAD-IC family P-type ATPase, partial [Thermodesulfobacteriota bacterium]|nr:HAD-IC family P-type ATPase [Thermodesulfobacteriota bacterium]
MKKDKNLPEKPNYHALDIEAVLEALNSKPEGLSLEEAQARLEIHGYNEMIHGKKISPVVIFLRQFGNLLMVILIIATGISFLLGEHLDAWVILAIIFACVILGFFQEYRAEKAAAALQQLAAPNATVLREDEEMVVPAREVVPGDILIIHTGDRMAADARLLKVVNLMIDESILTGESTPVDKSIMSSPGSDTAIADQRGMVFGGTVATYGRSIAVVTTTGMNTEFGRIASMLGEVGTEKTPLDKGLSLIGREVSIICLALAGGALAIGIYKGFGL